MEKEKISNAELSKLGINELELLVAFSRVANGLLKNEVMDKSSVLANLGALIDDPTPYALKKSGKFKNIADRVLQLRREGKFLKQARQIHELKKEISDFPVFGLDHIEVGALAQMKTAMRLPITEAGALMPPSSPGVCRPAGAEVGLRNTFSTEVPLLRS